MATEIEPNAVGHQTVRRRISRNPMSHLIHPGREMAADSWGEAERATLFGGGPFILVVIFG